MVICKCITIFLIRHVICNEFIDHQLISAIICQTSLGYASFRKEHSQHWIRVIFVDFPGIIEIKGILTSLIGVCFRPICTSLRNIFPISDGTVSSSQCATSINIGNRPAIGSGN